MNFRDFARSIRRIFCEGRSQKLPEYSQLSWAQEGEDLVLCSLFERDPPVGQFFVDVGAHHPQRFSNTWLFYQRGWKGINIDPVPDGMREFDRLRPRDINLQVGVSDRPGTGRLYLFDDSALATFSGERARHLESTHAHGSQSVVDVELATLSSILDQHLPDGQPIDFMSIDVECSELPVLRSMDWSRWRPTYLLVEDLDVAEGEGNLLNDHLLDIGYESVARTPRTVFFQTTRS